MQMKEKNYKQEVKTNFVRSTSVSHSFMDKYYMPVNLICNLKVENVKYLFFLLRDSLYFNDTHILLIFYFL